MTDQIRALQGQNPRRLRENPVKAHHHPDPRLPDVEHLKPRIPRLEPPLLLIEQMRLPIHIYLSRRAHQHRRIEHLSIRALRHPGHHVRVPIPRHLPPRPNRRPVRNFLRQILHLLLRPEEVPRIAQLGQHPQIRLRAFHQRHGAPNVSLPLSEYRLKLHESDFH